MDERLLVFIAGLHKSGTTMLYEWLMEHADVSGFRNTGVPRDEGQHLQTVYASAQDFGGPGRFGFDPQVHLTEAQASPEKAEELLVQWSAYWDLGKKVLVEKSPPNLLRTRLLRGLFPECKVIAITRHPIAVAVRTHRSWGVSVEEALRHWCLCHEVFALDTAGGNTSRWLYTARYEDFVDPTVFPKLSRSLLRFLGLSRHKSLLTTRQDENERAFDTWRAENHSHPELSERVARFGYSLKV